jgi:hypothetical protein
MGRACSTNGRQHNKNKPNLQLRQTEGAGHKCRQAPWLADSLTTRAMHEEAIDRCLAAVLSRHLCRETEENKEGTSARMYSALYETRMHSVPNTSVESYH